MYPVGMPPVKVLFTSLFIIFLFISLMSNAQNKHPHYLALGDSYTIGEGVEEEDRWPVILAHHLKMAPPTIIAKTGWTTDELQAAIDKAKPDTNYDLVSLLIGVNNQYRGYNPEVYQKEFAALLQQAISFAGNDPNHVLVVSIPDYGVTPFAAEKNPRKISEEIDRYNAISKKITEAAGVQYFNITPISRKAARDESLMAADQLHPSGKMYRMWVESFIGEVRAMMAKNK
jgi:lysophospholipase L1-like esterase